jgi:hypothetical protein
MFKDLKAKGSLLLSLIPVLGEGKGLGTGLFGITAEKGLLKTPIADMKFEPLIRGKRATDALKHGYNYARKYNAVEHAYKAAEAAKKAPNMLKNAGAHIADTLRPVTSAFTAKSFAEQRVYKDFTKATKEGATVLADNLKVGDIYATASARKAAEHVAYTTTKAEQTAKLGLENRKLFEVKKHWKALGVEFAARKARRGAKKENIQAVNELIKKGFEGRNVGFARKAVETGLKKAAPTVIEGTRAGGFKGFFERWLNLTPDVPVWLSTTTGVLELFGAHGIDAVPAVLQLGINSYKKFHVNKEMAMDVLGYTASRVINKVTERKRAAEVFRPATAGGTA